MSQISGICEQDFLHKHPVFTVDLYVNLGSCPDEIHVKTWLRADLGFTASYSVKGNRALPPKARGACPTLPVPARRCQQSV